MYENIENKKIPTIIGIKKNINGRVKKKINNIFPKATSLTSFLTISEYKNVKAKNARKGTNVTTPIKSNKSILIPKIWTEKTSGS